MNPFFTDEHRQFQAGIARWVDERLLPRAEAIDQSGEPPLDLFRELGQLGYFGIMYPEAYGGSGTSNSSGALGCQNPIVEGHSRSSSSTALTE